LDEISKNITDGTHQTPTYTKDGRIFLSAQNIKPFKFMPEDHKFVSEEAYEDIIKNRKPEKGDILIARVGAGIGEAAVINQDIDFCFYVSLGLVQPFKDYLNTDYLTLVINSPYGVKYAKGNISSKGGSAGNFNLGRIRSFLIPLPPLAEQERIVQKVEELMQYCNELETSIKQSESQNEKLLQQVLREALRKEPVEV
jgi:type I restriction enzyme S subunit